MAGSCRNWSFSLVGFESSVGMGKPAVAERRGAFAGHAWRGSVLWRSPGGARRKQEGFWVTIKETPGGAGGGGHKS